MIKNFVQSGYPEQALNDAKQRALQLDRTGLLNNSKTNNIDKDDQKLIFVSTYNPHVIKSLKGLFGQFKEDFLQLVGHANILYASRRNKNMSSVLFDRYGFCQTKLIERTSQKCGAKNCKMCPMLFNNYNPIELSPGCMVKPYKSATCKSVNCIYMARCKICNDFYFGQTFSEVRTRFNGHRSTFKPHLYKKSALSFHVNNDHPGRLNENTELYNGCVLEVTNPRNLNRLESYYIWKTEADIKHLNRFIPCTMEMNISIIYGDINEL